MQKQILTLFCLLLLALSMSVQASGRAKLNFNAGWRLCVGDVPEAAEAAFDDSHWQQVTLPYAFNGNEAFKKDIVNLTDTVVWYRKRFSLTSHPSPLPSKFSGCRLLPERPSSGL